MTSLNDPDFTGTGHQPMFYDQICGPQATTPYQKYRVLGSKLTVTFATQSPPSLAVANNAPCLVGTLTDANNSLNIAGPSSFMETSGSKWGVLQDKSGANNTKTFTCTYSPNRDLALDSGDDTLTAVYNSNPIAAFYGYIFKFDQGTVESTVIAYVQIEYLCEFFFRNDVSMS